MALLRYLSADSQTPAAHKRGHYNTSGLQRRHRARALCIAVITQFLYGRLRRLRTVMRNALVQPGSLHVQIGNSCALDLDSAGRLHVQRLRKSVLVAVAHLAVPDLVARIPQAGGTPPRKRPGALGTARRRENHYKENNTSEV